MLSSIFYPLFSNIAMVRRLFLTILSVALLICSYPTIDLSFLAFFALVPLLFILDGVTSRRAAFGWAYLCGLLFFWGTLYWFVHVTVPGAVLLILYLSLYFGLFGLFCYRYRGMSYIWKMLLLPSAWAALEFVRGNFASGFGWVSLGHSQYTFLALIQMADLTGVYGISFIVMAVNLALFFVIRDVRRERRIPAELKKCLAAAAVLMLGVFGYGFFRLGQPLPAQSIKAAVVQGNISQDLKWSRRAWPRIFEKYLLLTELAAGEDPDLIIWPESAFPGFVWEEPERFEELTAFVRRMGIPVLSGFVSREEGKYFNTAALLGKDGNVRREYRKIHLVPFGEYIPFRKLLPFLSTVVPIDDFTSGEEWTVFSTADGGPAEKERRFSALICFEDTVPRLARRFVREGADFLVNITNDAWFKDTGAPYLHLQAAVFRTVETRRSMVRAANTGLSCFIGPRGEILSCVGDARGRRTYVTGFATQEIPLSRRRSPYTFFGDIFTYACFGCILWKEMRRRRKKR